MGLRGRLALFFVAITVVPLIVAVAALRAEIDDQLDARAAAELASVRANAGALIAVQRSRAADLAADLARRDVAAVLDRGNPAAAQAWLRDALGEGLGERADLVLLVDADGRPLASQRAPARFADGAGPLPPDDAAVAAAARDRAEPEGLLGEVREVRASRPAAARHPAAAGPDSGERRVGWIVVGRWLDANLLPLLPSGEQAGIIGADGRVLAAGALAPDGITEALVELEADEAGDVSPVTLDGDAVLATAAPIGAGARLVLWTPAGAAGVGLGTATAVLAAAVVVAAALGWLLAGGIIAPVRRAASVARSVASGDLEQTLEPTGGRELEDLAVALNRMSAELAARLEEIEQSRDQLRQTLSRLGRTLSSSLDLNQMLAVVVESAMETFEADGGALHLLTPERDALYVKVGRGIGEEPGRVPVGEGVIGTVVRTGAPVRLPADADLAGSPAPGEVVAPVQLSLPLYGRGEVVGVLTILRDDPERVFSESDLATVGSFADQASVAIENVLLHQEAQRLSVTDPLTGLWNFRYFQQQAERELEHAIRFDRALALLVVDLDHFKQTNDRYGHQTGDAVLVEIGRRLHEATRSPDVVARYGGEEFVVLLPGADADGATRTAERVRELVREAPVRVAPGQRGADGEAETLELAVTCSIGVACFPAEGRTVAALLRSADAAMYAAKRAGRDRVSSVGALGVDPPGRANPGVGIRGGGQAEPDPPR